MILSSFVVRCLVLTAEASRTAWPAGIDVNSRLCIAYCCKKISQSGLLRSTEKNSEINDNVRHITVYQA